MEEIEATPVFRPIERIGQFAYEKYYKFDSKQEAELYANAGRSNMSSAFIGQRLSVREDDRVNVYVIDPNYNLAGISNSTSADRSSYVHFSYNDISGATLMTLDKDFYLQSLTVTIMEAFDQEAMFTIGVAQEDDEENYRTKFFGEDDLVSDEIGSYKLFFNETLSNTTTIRLWFADGLRTRGRATLKVN